MGRAGRIAAWIAFGAGALLLALWFIALTVARTEWAKDRLGKLVAEKATGAIAGKLGARELAVSGGLDVCLRGVSLQDPDGNVVLTADEACISIEALLLPRKVARIRSVRLTRPALDVAQVQDGDGRPATTLSRALAARHPHAPAPDPGPTAWTVRLDSLSVVDGSVRLRPALGAAPSFALEGLSLDGGQARYAASGAQARLGLTGRLTAPGSGNVALDLDALLEGSASAGQATLRDLRLRVGESGLSAQGRFDLAARRGELEVRELVVRPADVDALLPRAPAPGERGGPARSLLGGELHGRGTASIDGAKVRARIGIAAGTGTLSAEGEGSLSDDAWSVRASTSALDPAEVLAGAPRGEVTLQLAAEGRGAPRFDEDGVRGDLHGKLHVGPARLTPLGPLVADLEGDLQGRTALVKAFSATAVGLSVRARGSAARDHLALDLAADAPHLSEVERAIAAWTGKAATPLRGEAHLRARLGGTTRDPDARVSLSAPLLQVGGGLRALGLEVKGTLHGNLLRPTGALSVVSRDVRLGDTDLGAPRIALGLDWPLAHVRLESQVARRDGTSALRAQGEIRVAGDATIDDDRDGLLLSNFTVELPGTALRLAEPARVHLRAAETVIEPVELTSPAGSLRFSATLTNATRRRPAQVDAALVLSQIDLGRVPAFALPEGFHLAGTANLNAFLRGPRSAPDLDLALTAVGIEAQRVRGIDASAKAHIHGGRLRADAKADGPGGEQIDLHADAPLQNLATASPSAPIEASFALRGFDLAKVAQLLQSKALLDAHAAGTVEVRAIAKGTLSAPRAVVSVEAQHLSSTRLKEGQLHLGLLVEKGKASLDGQFELGSSRAVSLSAQAPFELLRALREPGYLKGAAARPLAAELAVADLTLDQLVRAGLLPLGSTGTVQGSLKLSGTPLDPQLSFNASGSNLSTGKLRNFDFQTRLEVDRRIRFSAGAQGAGQSLLRADASVDLASREVVQIGRRAAVARARAQAAQGKAAPGRPEAEDSLIDDATLDRLLDRALEIHLAIPGLVLGRAALVAGEKSAPAEGRLSGNIDVRGTPASPHLLGQLEVKDFSSQQKRLGNADLYLEGDARGALLHVGIQPPGGGTFLGHARLKAALGARALLQGGAASLASGELSANVQAKKLDLAFLSGLLPNLRRTGGKLDADVEVGGLLGRPQSTGEAHLRSGTFDVVGQGVFQDVAFDARFTPKEAVLDRLTGSLGRGTFSTVLTVSQRSPAADGEPAPVEFAGEAHLGDDESVRGRKDGRGRALSAGPLPLRQAGEERADLAGELDFFGDYSDGLLSGNIKIPSARLNVRNLPDKQLPNLDPDPDVLLVHPGEKPHPPGKEPEEVAAEERARKSARFRAHFDLDLEGLFVKAEDFEFKVESQMRFDYDAQHPDRPSADGTIAVPQGAFTALGRRFEIASAKITETGGDIADPELEIKARYENPQATVNVSVSGTAKQPQVDLSSNPPMDQDAIAFFLATGRIQGRATQQGGGVDLSGAASSVVGGLLFGQLRKSLADVLPVDVLTIETSQGGVSQASVGKYIGDRVFVGYRQRLIPAPGENTSEGRVEYEISRTLSAEATVGDRNSDVSILYTRDF